MNFKIMCWNIKGGRRLKEVIKLIQKQKPEVVALQEVDKNLARTGNIDVAQEIAETLDFNFLFAPGYKKQGKRGVGEMGNALLFKYPLRGRETCFLSPEVEYEGSGETEPRTVLGAELDIGGKSWYFLNTHLAVSTAFEFNDIKKSQLNTLLDVVNRTSPPLVLMGDLNSSPQTRVVKKIEEFLSNADPENHKTWPVGGAERKGWKVSDLQHTIDYIFISREIRWSGFKVLKSEASDHLPLTLTISN